MERTRLQLPNALEWQPVIDGAEMAVLYGDPSAIGAYAIRFRTHREILVPLHWHREDEHVTILAGSFGLSLDQELDGKRSELSPGSYAVIPAGVRHQAWYGVDTVIQVSGMGPFESIYVDPASDLGDRIQNEPSKSRLLL